MGAVDEWVMHDDHYYVNQQACSLKPKSLNELKDWPVSEFRPCKKCHEEREELLERQSLLLQRHGRLRGLELFSGKTFIRRFYCHPEFGFQVLVVLGPVSICPVSWRLDGRSNFHPVQHEPTGEVESAPCLPRTHGMSCAGAIIQTPLFTINALICVYNMQSIPKKIRDQSRYSH